MRKIKKAVVAVAWSWTRLLPATKSMPKEMLPIVDKPIAQLVVEELVEAWIEDIIFVTRWDKKPLEDHFDHSTALEDDLRKNNKIDLLNKVEKIAEMANFIYIRQKWPYGNGTPALSADSLIEDGEPFVFVWWDDLVKSKVSFTKQMIEDYEKNWNLMIWVQEVPKEEVSKYWIVKLRKWTNEIEDIIEKPSIMEAPSQLADFWRMILDKDFIKILKKTALWKWNELWIVDAIKQYVNAWWIFLAKEIEDWQWLTTWDPLNYLKTTIEYVLDRDDLKDDFIEYVKSRI